MSEGKDNEISLLEGQENQKTNAGHLVLVEEDDPETQCGIGSCKPRAFQVFANITAFTGFCSITSLLSSTLLAYVNSQVTTLERQFGFTSSETGIIMASNDIGYMLIVVFVAHFAHRSHIPRVMSASVMLFGISGLICCLPHFLFGTEQSPNEEYVVSNVTSQSRAYDLCSLANDSLMNFCEESDSPDKPEVLSRSPRDHAAAALGIIVIGMALQGVAKAPRNAFTITYVDGNVEKSKTGYYMGIIISMSIFGPAIAFSLGSYFTRIYVTLEDTDLYPRHPRWIGAWWLGYLVFGSAAVIMSVSLFFFPRRLKSAPPSDVLDDLKKKKKELNNLTAKLILEAKDYIKVLVGILTNPLYATLVLASVCHLFSVGGAHAFMPKYMENQFGLPAWKANLLMAGLSMPMASLGTFVGGWLTKKFKMSPITGLKFVNVFTFVTVIIVSLGYVFGCPQPKILNQPGTTVSSTADQGDCHSSTCHCNDNDYFPICGSDNNNYYSPCHAGCLAKNGPSYTNCTCIPNGGKASPGLCDFDCPFLYPYAVTLAVSAFLSTMLIMPKIIIKIRSVTEKEKPIAVGFSSFMTSMFGFLLGPIIYGRVIDSTCLIWDSPCGERGACALYDIVDFRQKIHGFFVVSRSVTCVCLVAALVIAIKTKKFETLNPTKEKELETLNPTKVKEEKGIQ
ncbi:solute carrier organic anion transporter family member 2A1-like [Haliotis rufescens]|uniref:solute carrier organic anion transporter family member 2A1-like n=1 Tax=Haliotis rufescens TaxID=6454 RepID=UPI00201F88B9|nr:solute carrier organic anion transporter family member 2A1-like [Haliotis rufescens]XP_046362540.2 solute carrier organic anion transporter family member 2A1-like [Haliotis rufescens]